MYSFLEMKLLHLNMTRTFDPKSIYSKIENEHQNKIWNAAD